MTPHVSGADSWLALLFAAAGLAFGWGYFTTLRRSVAACAGRGGLRRCLGWLLARLMGAAIFFAFALHWGAWPLLAAFLGFLGARQLALRAAGRVI
jgi:hypothetical protein